MAREASPVDAVIAYARERAEEPAGRERRSESTLRRALTTVAAELERIVVAEHEAKVAGILRTIGIAA